MRYGTPTSDFGRLGLGDSEGEMVVNTRSMSQRQSRQSRRERDNLAASQAASSRAAVGSSRRQSQRLVARRSGQVQRPSTARSGNGDSDDSSSDDDDDDDDDDDEDQDEDGRRRNWIMLRIMAINDPGLATPEELAGNPAHLSRQSQYTRNVALVQAALIRSGQDEARMRAFLQGRNLEYWNAQLLANMQRRVLLIQSELRKNVNDTRDGADVVQTVMAMHRLFRAIDRIRVRFFDGMGFGTQQGFVGVLVQALGTLVNDRDQYEGTGTVQPNYAAEAMQSTRRLFSCFVSETSHTYDFLNIFNSFSPELLRGNGVMAQYCTLAINHIVARPPNDPDRARLDQLHRAFHAIYERI